VVVIVTVKKRRRSSSLFLERRELLHQAALTTGGVVLVDDAFLGSLIQGADGCLGRELGVLTRFLAVGNLRARLLNGSAGLATVDAVFHALDIVLFIAFYCRLDVSQTKPPKLIERGLILP